MQDSVPKRETVSKELPIKGVCQCGNVSYELYEKPKAVWACHCTECQKLSTAPFSVTVIVPSSAIQFRGELKDWSRSADSGNINAAKFCPDCGNRIYHYNPDDPSVIKLKLKPANPSDHFILEPTVHVWVSQKQSWYEIPKGVDVFEGQP